MKAPYVGQAMARSEDYQLLTGQGLYTDDVLIPGTLHAALLRASHAHARIKRIDTSQAEASPGVVAVYTHADLTGIQDPLPKLIPHPSLLHHKTQYALAPGIVRHAGEAVAVVVADSRYAAEDAVERITVEYEPLPVVHGLEQAVSEDAPLVHPDIDTNVAAQWRQETGDVDAAFAQADHIFHERLAIDRGAAHPIETRGVVAHYDRNVRQLTVWDSTQAPTRIRTGLAELLGLTQQQVRVIASDVGGGFGVKIMMFYPEEILIPWLAMRLGRPVKWIEDRREHFYAANHEREQIHNVEIAVRADGTILGIKDDFIYDAGAFISYGLIIPIVAQCTLPGPYKLPNYRSEFRAVFTNRTMVSPYRGAGRPHGVYVMERLLDRVAKELDLDRAEVRRRNLIQPDEFPYDVGLIYQDGAPLRYDSGNYPALLDKVLDAIEYDQWPEKQRAFQAEGRWVGLAIAPYVEGTGVGPYEGARLRVDPSGKVFVATGVGTQGQSHLTTFAQVAADQLGVHPSDVHVITGDTGEFGWGIGTFASRAAVVAGNAVHLAAQAAREKALGVAGRLLGCSPDDVILADGRAHVRGAPERSVTLGEVSNAANPLRGTLPEGEEPGLEVTRWFSPAQAAYAAGIHAAIIEIDPKRLTLQVHKYVVVHDCGKVINPQVVEGQIHGGLAQGIGGAFYEKLVYDEAGQLLTASFMDYLLPTACEMPDVEIYHLETPSPLNPLGVKGCGEAGVIPVAALFASAVDDALSDLDVFVREMPLSPDQLHQLIGEAAKRRTAQPAGRV